MATYRYELLPVPNTPLYEASLKLAERPIYGSSRLGSFRKQEELFALPTFDPLGANPIQQADLNYELTDHLGNVTAVVSGRLLDGNGGGTPKQAELLSAQGYEPFGSLLPGRNCSSGSYRFGFGGMPKDDEMHGATGTSYDYGARLYDPRVGRWLSLDPLAAQAPGKSPYAYVSNNPISRVDKDGKIDFQYTVTYRCNPDKTYTKVIKATAIYYVVNLSSTPYFDAGNIPSERHQDWKATIKPKNVDHPDGTQITSVEFDLRFETRNLDAASYSKLPQHANVHFVVDAVKNSAKHGDMAGYGSFEGQAIVSELGEVRGRTHVTHERGHNFGFLFERNPMDGDDPHHSADKSNVMSYGGGGEFPLGTMREWLRTSGILGGQPEGTYSYGNGKAQQDGIRLLKDNAAKYDASKYDKITR